VLFPAVGGAPTPIPNKVEIDCSSGRAIVPYIPRVIEGGPIRPVLGATFAASLRRFREVGNPRRNGPNHAPWVEMILVSAGGRGNSSRVSLIHCREFPRLATA
jgi:hypothetical protein